MACGSRSNSSVRCFLRASPYARNTALAVFATPVYFGNLSESLRAFLDPYQDPQGIGYHVLQSMAAVSGGGMAGRGLGNGLQKFGYLPEDTTDFIFAIICEELGIVGATVVIALRVIPPLGFVLVLVAERSRTADRIPQRRIHLF